MALEYRITYNAENKYDRSVKNAVWQFLIIPENNDNQEVTDIYFNNSLNIPSEDSINGFGFRTLRLNPKTPFTTVQFTARFKVLKHEVNPFDFIPDTDIEETYRQIDSLGFRVEFEPFLRDTVFTLIPPQHQEMYVFDRTKGVFDNLIALTNWVYLYLKFQSGVTHVGTTLEEVITSQKGVCQDFTHLLCGLARKNGIPVRYVSGYLHQGNGYFGDSQMHAWAEAYVPEAGWTGFDPTNDILAGNSHIKVAHGKDYQDCAPLKGVIFAPGENQTTHNVEVSARQSQQ
jgi:transglutaminase-like putative cysteine protease